MPNFIMDTQAILFGIAGTATMYNRNYDIDGFWNYIPFGNNEHVPWYGEKRHDYNIFSTHTH